MSKNRKRGGLGKSPRLTRREETWIMGGLVAALLYTLYRSFRGGGGIL